MAHILASLMFGLIAFGAAGTIAIMLIQARSAMALALGVAAPDRVRQYRAPMRVKVRRTATWPASRLGGTRRAA